MNRKYRKTIIAGNWKMNKTPSETKEFMTTFKSILPKGRWCDVVFCVPAVCIPAAVRAMRETRVGIGGENMNANASGAYTGDIAANMLVDAGCKYVIIGHSERRAMGETDADVNAKVLAALEAGLIPILCCGESQGHHRLRAHLGHWHRPHCHPGASRGSLRKHPHRHPEAVQLQERPRHLHSVWRLHE